MTRVKSSFSSSVMVLAIAVLVMTFVGQSYGQLSVGYYKGKCGRYDVESEIYKVVSAAVNRDKSVVGALLRLVFHDSYGGCDASLLLDGPEKNGSNNKSVRGYDVVDACKASLEAKCPGVVSCTDVMVIATRSAVSLVGGKWFNVETGRRDGLTSYAQTAAGLPGTKIAVKDAVSQFALRKLSAQDFVVLLGAGHTVGFIHCSFFLDRLYNFQQTGLPDPSMNTNTLASLRKTCPSGGSTNFVFADQTVGSGLRFDKGFFLAIKQGKGLLQIDQRIASDPITKNIVTNLATTSNFDTLFPGSFNKLVRFGVLTGTKGQIRKNCHRVNGK